MNADPRILLWNYSFEEMLQLDHFFQSVEAPLVQAIEKDQGHLLVEDILFSDKRSDQEFSCDEKVMLFFNVPGTTIHTIMQEAKKWDLPKPIYAVVTDQSIQWTFAELADHLIKERDFIKKKMDEERSGSGRSHT